MQSQTTSPPPPSSRHGSPWREPWFALLAGLLPLVVAGVAAWITPDFALGVDDSVSQVQPHTSAIYRQLAAGRLPLWGHHIRCGMPLYSMGYALHPGSLVGHLVGLVAGLPNREVAIAYLAYMMAGSFCAWLFLRHHGCRPAAAAVGTIAFVCSGPFWGFWTNWNPYGWAAGLVPPTLLAIDVALAHRGRVRDGWREVVLVGVALSPILLIADLQMILKHAFLGTGYVLLRADRRAWRQGVPVLVAGAVVAVLCGLAQCLAVRNYIGQTTRVSEGGVGFEQFFFMSVPYGGLCGLIDPFVRQSWYAFGSSTFHGAALSVGPLLPVVAGVFFTRRWWSQSVPRALTVIFGSALLLALGSGFPPNELLLSIPVVNNFRWPMRWTLEACTVGALLVGLAVESLMGAVDNARSSPDAWRQAGRLVLACAIAFVAAWGVRSLVPDGGEDHASAFSPSSFGWFIAGGAVLATAAAGLAPGRERLDTGRLLGVVAIVVSLGGGLLSVPIAQRQRFSNPDLRNLVVNPLDVSVGEYERVWPCLDIRDQKRLLQGGNLVYGLPLQFDGRSVSGYGYPLRWQQWGPFIGLQGQIEPFEAFHQLVLDPRHKGLLSLLRVGAIVISAGDEDSRKKLEEHPDFSLQQATDQLLVFRHHGFRDPAWFVEEVAIVPPGPLPLHLLDTRRTAVLWDQSLTKPVVRKTTPGNRVVGFREHHGSIDLQVDCPADGFLVVNTTFFPGWEATVDGRAADVTMADAGFMGLAVRRGVREVALRFRPRWLIDLLFFSTACWIAVVAVFAACVVPWLIRGWRAALDHPSDPSA